MPDDTHIGSSGGHPVAKALRARCAQVIDTAHGGRIIDIYDGCVDECIEDDRDEGMEVVHVRHQRAAAGTARIRLAGRYPDKSARTPGGYG